MPYIPVTFEIIGVEADAVMSFTLCTQGARWSMGRGPREGLGFSLNAKKLGPKFASNVRKVGIAGSVLEIWTSADVTREPLTLTLFAEVQPNTVLLEGRCIVSDTTQVFISLGGAMPVEWRGRLFAAGLPRRNTLVRRATFSVQASKAGEVVRIFLRSESDQFVARWCLGPRSHIWEDHGAPLYFRISSTSEATLPMQKISVNENEIKLVTCSPIGVSSPENIVLNMDAYIECLPQGGVVTEDARAILLRAECDACVSVTAQVDTYRPRYLGKEYTSIVFFDA